MAWERGLKATVDWYKRFSGNWGEVEAALVAHPRRGYLTKEITEGVADLPADEASDPVAAVLRGRAST
jgi:hypothetical protein